MCGINTDASIPPTPSSTPWVYAISEYIPFLLTAAGICVLIIIILIIRACMKCCVCPSPDELIARPIQTKEPSDKSQSISDDSDYYSSASDSYV